MQTLLPTQCTPQEKTMVTFPLALEKEEKYRELKRLNICHLLSEKCPQQLHHQVVLKLQQNYRVLDSSAPYVTKNQLNLSYTYKKLSKAQSSLKIKLRKDFSTQ